MSNKDLYPTQYGLSEKTDVRKAVEALLDEAELAFQKDLETGKITMTISYVDSILTVTLETDKAKKLLEALCVQAFDNIDFPVNVIVKVNHKTSISPFPLK